MDFQILETITNNQTNIYNQLLLYCAEKDSTKKIKIQKTKEEEGVNLTVVKNQLCLILTIQLIFRN